MHSSTFSSSQLPAAPWLRRVWWVALLVAGVLLVAAELGWRRLGFLPSVKDTPELWSQERTRASEGEGRDVVLVGSSRFQSGLVLEELSTALGGARVHQLAISGSSSLPILEDLAEDEHFRGLVLCEVTPTFLFSVEPNAARERPEQYVKQHRHRTVVSNWEAAMRAWMQERLVVLLSELHAKNVVRHLLIDRKPPPRPFSRFWANREQQLEPDTMNVPEMRKMWAQSYQSKHGRPAEPSELQNVVERVGTAAERIRARGGEVIFVRMVSSGAVRRIEDERYPRERYWDPLIARTGNGLSFEDVPALARFECLEDAHLDRHVAPEFTRLLGQELQRYRLSSVVASGTR